MTLTELIAELKQKGSSGVETVICDYQEKLNYFPAGSAEKIYPIVLWDFNSYDSTENFETGEELVDMNVYVIGSYDKNSKTEARTMAEVWDSIHDIFKLYVANLNSRDSILIDNRLVGKELFDFGVLSIDAEIGIGYKVQIKVYC